MDKIKSKSSTIVFFAIWFIYIAFFSFIITVIREDGYLNFEPLFITSHVTTLFEGGELVKNFFLSYPLITNMLSYPFSIFSPEDAPFFASVFYMSLLATTVVTIVGQEKNNVIKGLLFLYFLFSPVTIYAATSGTSVYAFFALYFLIFYYLFNYIKKFTTYHITILSIILSLAVFLDYRILWLLLLLLLYAFVFSIYGVKGLRSANIIIKYIKITQHRSLRRKLRGRLVSMVFIIGFFPVTTLLLYLFINYLMGNDSFYFFDSLETKWNGNSFFSLLEPDTLVGLNNRTVNDFSFLDIVIFLMPIYLFELIIHYKKGLKIFILLLAPILLYTLVRDSITDYMSLSYYTILIACGLASIATTPYKFFKLKKLSYFFYACLFVVSIYGEYLYLKKSSFTSEQIYYKSVVEKEQNSVLLEYKKAGEFLASNTPENSVILSDRSILYPIIAYNSKNNYFISNSSDEFEKATYDPYNHCDYIIITNTKSPYHFLDKVDANLKNIKNNKFSIYSEWTDVVYYSNSFTIVKVVK
ncbi:hypothetical protein ACFFVB_05015 [Formosa undariae]|uniref:Glycosyltransferase RgtA/B/C/D-like domain-containing protein n=1 Tax=Formosa undariae TaxID=1325436 RepID=A0ABV5EZT3_9FLAO